MPRDASTPLEGRYTDNDSSSTNELDVDWQGVTLYNLLPGAVVGRQCSGDACHVAAVCASPPVEPAIHKEVEVNRVDETVVRKALGQGGDGRQICSMTSPKFSRRCPVMENVGHLRPVDPNPMLLDRLVYRH
jgi:hypothetical protein